MPGPENSGVPGRGRRPAHAAQLQLLAVSVLFGATLPVIQYGLQFFGSFTFMAIRFAIGAAILVAISLRQIVQMPRTQLAASSLTGVLAFAAWGAQTAALNYSSVSKVGFITALYVPIVALLTAVMGRRAPGGLATAGILASTAGMMLLSLGPAMDLAVGRGEILALGSALAMAGLIVGIDKLAPAADAGAVAATQVAVTAVLSTAMVLSTGEPLPAAPWTGWASPVFMGISVTAVGFALMNRAQKHVPAMAATLLYALEPVWSALTGYLDGNRLSALNWAGCAAIAGGLILSQPRGKPPGTDATPKEHHAPSPEPGNTMDQLR